MDDSASRSDDPASNLTYTSRDRLVTDFASRGLVVLAPESLGVARETHQTLYEQEKALFSAGERITASSLPLILDILSAPGLVDACNQLVGQDWAIVPFTHNTPFVSGSNDQHWHKDDNGPFNGRRPRHHHAVQIEMLYYPQAVTAEMGPTATIPYSQYWGFNHEENHDNFAGADHLDFAYHLSGMERVPISGPKSDYGEDAIRERRTDHDVRMRDAVTSLGWPLVQPFEAAPLEAGSVVLYSHNLFHRGNHRRDDWRSWKARPRFMWRFWLFRTTDPDPHSAVTERQGNSRPGGADTLTGQSLDNLGEDITAVWNYHEHWLQTGASAQLRRPSEPDDTRLAERLLEQIQEFGEAAEPRRIGAAYRLAALADPTQAAAALETALHVERESVRRAATYGLIALGEAATPAFLRAAESPVKWLRKAAIQGLGSSAPATPEVLAVLAGTLRDDASVYVRSVAADAIGSLARRAIRTEALECVATCAAVLTESLGREPNRLAMNIAQGRSIKLVRPTDECDVCEGIGIDYSHGRLEPVRSAVRENALCSLVVLCSHGASLLGEELESTIAALTNVVDNDRNVFCVGYAMDALTRLARLGPATAAPALDALREELPALISRAPLKSLESLIRGGLSTAAARDFEADDVD